MGAFDDVTFQWAGVSYTIPANKMMGAIARIEDHVTMPELQRFGERGAVPLSRLAGAFASVLRYAGANVVHEDVYAAMFAGAEKQMEVAEAVSLLMAMMVPAGSRDKILKVAEEAKAAGAVPPGNPVPAATASSKKLTKSRSGKRGSRL